MKEICIINVNSNAIIYGIGTFLKEYIICLKKIGIKIHFVELNSSVEEFSIIHQKSIVKYIFPLIDYNRDKYYNNVVTLLGLHLKDSGNLLFHINFYHPEIFFNQLKLIYPSSKILFTIHYQEWTWLLNGNQNKFKNIIKYQNKSNILSRHIEILEIYRKERAIYQKVDYVICLCLDSYYLVKHIYEIEDHKIQLIPNGMDVSFRTKTKQKESNLRKQFFLSETEKIILFVGRLDKMKGFISLISSFKYVLEIYPNCRLIIVGEVSNIHSLNMTKNIWSKITFTGHLSSKELDKWYRIADIGVIPSFSEQCSFVGLEMMAYGLPIVATNGMGVQNMFIDKQNAKIAKIENFRNLKKFEHNLSVAIIDLLLSPSTCIQLGQAAKKFYKNNYSSFKNKIDIFFKQL